MICYDLVEDPESLQSRDQFGLALRLLQYTQTVDCGRPLQDRDFVFGLLPLAFALDEFAECSLGPASSVDPHPACRGACPRVTAEMRKDAYWYPSCTHMSFRRIDGEVAKRCNSEWSVLGEWEPKWRAV